MSITKSTSTRGGRGEEEITVCTANKLYPLVSRIEARRQISESMYDVRDCIWCRRTLGTNSLCSFGIYSIFVYICIHIYIYLNRSIFVFYF